VTHSCVTPTIRSFKPNATHVSVAEGIRHAIRNDDLSSTSTSAAVVDSVTAAASMALLCFAHLLVGSAGFGGSGTKPSQVNKQQHKTVSVVTKRAALATHRSGANKNKIKG